MQEMDTVAEDSEIFDKIGGGSRQNQESWHLWQQVFVIFERVQISKVNFVKVYTSLWEIHIA